MKRIDFALVIVSIAFLLVNLGSVAQQSVNFLGQATPQQKGAKINCSPTASVDGGGLQSSTQQDLAFHSYGAFWQVGEGYSSTLFLRNRDEKNQVTANVVVLSHEGKRIQKKQLVVAANSLGRLALTDLIRTGEKNSALQWGSLVLEFRQPSRTFGSVIVENEREGIIFDVPVQGGYRYDTDNSLYVPWWLPDHATDGTVTMFNASGTDIIVSASIVTEGSDHVEPALSIASHETKKFSLRSLMSKHMIEGANRGSVTLRYSGPPHALFPALLLSNPQTGFSLVPDINAQHDHPRTEQTRWSFPAVFTSPDSRLGFRPEEKLTAYALLSNGTKVSVTTEMSAYITDMNSAVETVRVPVPALGPFETRLIDLSAFLAGANSSQASHVALNVQHGGSAGDLAVTVFSIGPTKDFVFRSQGSVHPSKLIDSKYWDISNGLVSILTVQNPSSTAIRVDTTLTYSTSNGVGSYTLPPIDLPQNGSHALNLTKAILAQVPDPSGHVIPAGTEFGTLKLEIADKKSPGVLFGYSEVFDPVKGGYGFGGLGGCDLCDSCEDCVWDGDGIYQCVEACNSWECCPPPPPPGGTPDHLQVLNDVQQSFVCSPNVSSRQRQITYVIEDIYGSPMLAPTLMREDVPPTTSSCNGNPVRTGLLCNLDTNLVPNILGEFTDFLVPGCPGPGVIQPCGFTFPNQQWQWCVGGGAVSMGTVGRVNVQNTLIDVNGNILGMVPGTLIIP